MIKGTVNRDIEPTLSVEIVRRDGHTLSVDATLDTGFSGDLLLPSETIRQAALSRYSGSTPLRFSRNAASASIASITPWG